MIVCSYRITQKKYTPTAFDGEGARLYGGRWNSVGTRMVYTASSLSLATLELLVHLEDYAALEGLYRAIPIEFDDTLIKTLLPDNLPLGWNRPEVNSETQLLGDAWVENMSSVVLAVPSAITVDEVNYLLNPAHPDFGGFRIGTPRELVIDSRLQIERPEK